jgi:hypothetical protein
MRNVLKFLALVAAVSLPTSGPVLAQRGDAATEQYCTSDYFRLCSGLDPDGKEVEQCFTRNRRNLSPACRQAIDAYERSQADESTSGVGSGRRPSRPDPASRR